MPSKLALHILTPSPAIDALIGSAPWAAVKAVGNPAPLAVAAAAGVPLRIFRQYGVEAMDPAGAVAAIAAHDLSQVTHLQLCCEDNKGYDPVWQLAVMDGLRARGYTGRYLLCGAATGNPPKIVGDPPHFPELEPLYGLLRRPDTDLSLDAYTGLLAMDPRWAAWAPYTVFRPTLIRADLARQGIPVNVVVTESGGDNIAPVTTGGGWQSRNWSADEYLKTLLAVDADDRQHPWLLARCLFTSGPTPDWWAFDIAPIAAQLAAYVATQAGTAPQSRQDAPQGTVAAQTAPAPVVTPTATVATPAGPAGRNHALSIDNIPEMNQGPTSLCWAETTQEAFSGAGYSLSVYDLYKQVKGVDYVAPGLPATFGELTQCVLTAAKLTGATVKWFGAMGRVNDMATFDQLLRDGSWVVVVGANEQVLVNDLGLAENAGYGHYFICKHIDFNADGTPDTYTIDSYRAFDNVPVRIPLGAVHDAMRQNWDANYDALAYSIK